MKELIEKLRKIKYTGDLNLDEGTTSGCHKHNLAVDRCIEVVEEHFEILDKALDLIEPLDILNYSCFSEEMGCVCPADASMAFSLDSNCKACENHINVKEYLLHKANEAKKYINIESCGECGNFHQDKIDLGFCFKDCDYLKSRIKDK